MTTVYGEAKREIVIFKEACLCRSLSQLLALENKNVTFPKIKKECYFSF